MKVKLPFVLNGKTYLPGSDVQKDTFVGKEFILKHFLENGFVTEGKTIKPGQKIVEKKEEPKPLPVKAVVPQVIEIKTQEDFVKAVETKKPEDTVETEKLEVKPVQKDNLIVIEKEEEKKPMQKEDSIEIKSPTKTKGRIRRD